MASEPFQTSYSSIPRGSLVRRKLFDQDAMAAFDRVRKAIGSRYATFIATHPASLNVDITTVYRAITANRERISRLVQKKEDLKRESAQELKMKETLQLETRRLEMSLAIHRREINNIEIREEIRRYELGELEDLELVTLVQALREETPEEWWTETGSGDDMAV